MIKRNKLLNAILILTSFSVFSARAETDDYTKELFELYCKSCHTEENSGAPQAFNQQDWNPRLSKGMQRLLVSTINGKGNMPPQGMCMECTEEDFQALIGYMSKPQN